jgi:hypothetical protein
MHLGQRNDRPGKATGVEIGIEIAVEADAVTKTGTESRHLLWSHCALVMFEEMATGEEQSGREKGGRHPISEAGYWQSRQSCCRGGGRESDAARYH